MKYACMQRGTIAPPTLIASALIALLSITGFLVVPMVYERDADMFIEPRAGMTESGQTFVVEVVVRASTPVNVFRGEIGFDPVLLSVESIDYNTSIADLWAEEPWYENGDGTITFTGGTTARGGFLGTGTLIKVTFRARGEGTAAVHVHEARILAHDGLGSDVPLEAPIDSLFQVEESTLDRVTVATPSETTAVIAVGAEYSPTDLNRDGKQSLGDVSVFLLGMGSGDARFDLNSDGAVNAKDLSIVMSAR